ncbi:hypothetical protein [Deinococcus sp. QL22]|uniref:hypothetical protein n=1 Tax=Deinococcus sp. QL22 TaxID=2939437 RepID=UPI0020174EE3|nr:hypothetical protein [Deinococcus sp. QL22]UQN04847.1 hypothetical protein M1R55_07895 [Deinococcus sp. QL22]
MQRFQLIRTEDVSGCSGTGAVAEGVIFSDGSAAMRWNRPPCSTAFYASIDDLIFLHGHEGLTTVQVIDQPIPAEFASG